MKDILVTATDNLKGDFIETIRSFPESTKQIDCPSNQKFLQVCWLEGRKKSFLKT
ncbi:MAG: hypothetical protein IPP69_14335 [Flavobacteriales bacterium]|nr:hypothetical protein [Flavobacteriales bacterium]